MANESIFPGQLDDENVIICERRHWYTIIKWAKRPFLLLLFSSLAAWAATALTGHASALSLILYGIVAVAATWFTWEVLDWENDRYIVTNRRVIHIEKVYLVREKRDEAPLAMIQDVSVDMQGLMTNLLYFGDVIIQTAGTLGTIRFRGIPKPRKAQAQILALMSQARPALPLEEEEEEPEAIRVVREILGAPRPEPEPLPAAAEGLRWESEQPRRTQLLKVLRLMVFAHPDFGENQKIWRKHWWALVTKITSPALTFFILIILWSAASLILGFNIWFDVLLGISLIANAVRLIWLFIDWENDLYVITDNRAVDIEKVPFIREHRREASLDKIQDVRYLQEGFIATRLDFGNVRLETAGGIGEFTFDSVPHPRQVQIEIFKRMERFHREAAREEKKKRAEELINLLGRYHQEVQGSGGTES